MYIYVFLDTVAGSYADVFWPLSCRFEDLLRALTLERRDICDAMVFALDNAASAGEVLCFPSHPPSQT
jgi:hypothetical protein